MDNFMLFPEDIDALKSIAESHTDPRTSNQAKAILLLNEGEQTKQEIAESIGMTRSGLYRLQKRFERDGLALFAGESKVGRPAKITNKYRKELDLALQSYPRGLGLDGGYQWTAALLVEYMSQKTGVELSIWSMRDLLNKMGYTYQWRREIVQIGGQERKKTVQSLNKEEYFEDRYDRP